MAEVRNTAGEDRYIPAAGRIVPDGESFDIGDDLYDSLDWNPDLFKVVTPPLKSKKSATSGNKE